MAEKLYPARQRCKNCSKKLDKIVLNGLYCSYRCGNLSSPYTNIDEAPRTCKTERNGKWEWKRKFRAVSEVPTNIQEDPATNLYTCEHCHFIHIGHSRALGSETARLIGDAETLGSVLLRVREGKNLTRKEVASAIKTRPIRLKEIEEAEDNVDINVVFNLLRFYRMKMNLLF